jgi:hypothetical protein
VCPRSRELAVRSTFVAHAVVALLGAAVLGAPNSAMARELHIESFDARIVVTADAWTETTETIRVRFDGAWNGLYRTIPVEYRTHEGFNASLWLDVERVTDDDGTPLKHELSRAQGDRKLQVFVPGAVNATKTIVLTYRVANALRFFDDHDELYWNVTGNNWDVPVGAASARIELPGGVTGVRAIPYTGAFGSRGQAATVKIEGTKVDVRCDARLGLHEGLTVVIGWDKGIVRRPTWSMQVALFLRSNWALFLPIILLGLMWLLWRWRGRDPRLRPIVVRYKPPEGLTPGEAGGLIDDKVDIRDVTSTIVDLAVRRYLAIEETATGYVFHRQKEAASWGALKRHEQLVLHGIFGDGRQPTVPLSSLKNVFYKNLREITGAILDSLTGRGFYVSRPDKVRRRYVILAVVVAALIFYAGLVAENIFGMALAPFIIAGFVTLVMMCVFAWYMPARTAPGTLALEELLGFRDFVEHVEAPRFRHMTRTPELFEGFLPFALAFGVEMQWAAAFGDIYVSGDGWYASSSGQTFRASDFASNVTRMSSSMETTLQSSPSDSGSSGFSGGSSGGGSGGGGGGGF